MGLGSGAVILASVLLLRTGLAEEPPKVGESCDPSRMVYRGLVTYTAEDITKQLNRQPDFLLASHPFAPLPALLSYVEKSVRSGYLHNGFPDARVVVRLNADTRHAEVTVEEGPRYSCDGVSISGLGAVPAADLKAKLARPRPPSPYRDPTDADAKKVEPPVWEKGTPAKFAENSLKMLRKNVRDALSQLGYFFPEFDVQVVRNDQDRSADLHVRVTDEGPKGVIGEIEVTGVATNTPQEMADHLGIKVGDQINSTRIQELEKRLWDCGRFWGYRVWPKPRQDGSKRVDLMIRVTELRNVPPLSQPLSDTARAHLKFREWALGARDRDEDLVISGTRPPQDGKEGAPEESFMAIISPRQGFLFRMNASLSQKTETGNTPLARVDFSLVARTDGVSFFWAGSGAKLESTDVPFAVVNQISLLPNPKKEPEFALRFGFGVKGGSEIRPDETPYILSLRIAPSALVSKAYDEKAKLAFEEGILVLRTEEMKLRIDPDSGRLIDATSPEGDGSWWEARFVTGVFDKEVEAHRERASGLANLYEPGKPVSSFISYVGRALILAGTENAERSPEVSRRARKALLEISSKAVLAPLDRFLKELPESRAHSFVIPPDPEATRVTSMGDLLQLMVKGYWYFYEPLFPRNTWPWALGRDVTLILTGRGQYSMATLRSIFGSESIGPVGLLATAAILKRLNPRLALPFAAKGLERLSTDYFRKDCLLLLHGDAVLPACARSLLEAVGNLEQADIDALGESLPGPEGQWFRDCHRLLHGASAASVGGAVQPALDHYWESALRARVEERLRSVLQEAEKALQPKPKPAN